MTLEPGPEPSPRIGDVERDEAVSLLQDHLAAGRLDNTEFDDRLGTALEARTYGELTPLFADLPGRRPGEPTPAPVPVVPGPPSAEVERRKQIGGIVVGALWPAAIVVCFATSWQFWWIMLVPIFLSGVIGQVFGLWSNADRPDRPDRRRRHLGH